MKQKIINLIFFSLSLLVINKSYSEESTTQTNQEQNLTLSQNWQVAIQYAQENLPLEGQLLAKSDGFGYIKVDDQYIHTLFPMLGLAKEGFEEPDNAERDEAIANLLPETELERQIINDPEWIQGASWGEPRPGHPEGAVIYHILEVLNNVETLYGDSSLRENLRVLTLIHDTFKNKVDRDLPTKGENQHGMIARRFAEQFTEDSVILNILKWHDDAYSAWKKGANGGDWDAALISARSLIDALGSGIDLYVAFYTCDNMTGDKTQEPLEWFKSIVAEGVE